MEFEWSHFLVVLRGFKLLFSFVRLFFVIS